MINKRFWCHHSTVELCLLSLLKLKNFYKCAVFNKWRLSHKIFRNELRAHSYSLRLAIYIDLILEIGESKSQNNFILKMSEDIKSLFIYCCVKFWKRDLPPFPYSLQITLNNRHHLEIYKFLVLFNKLMCFIYRNATPEGTCVMRSSWMVVIRADAHL